MNTWTATGRLLLMPLPLLIAACAPLASPDTQPRIALNETVALATLHGKSLDLHVARPVANPVSGPLVLYASGDGGWFGTAVDMWRQIARDGYVAVGFSARSFLKIERPRGSVMTPAQVALEYRTLIDQSRRAVGLPPDAPVILTGWSRGASFAVLVGSDPLLERDILGVVAIGLAEDEDLMIDGAEDETDDGHASAGARARPFDNYERIGLLPQRCAVIQATHDNYFPAADARRRFGSDTSDRHFYEVDAANHRFSHGTMRFYEALGNSLQWIAGSQLSRSGR